MIVSSSSVRSAGASGPHAAIDIAITITITPTAFARPCREPYPSHRGRRRGAIVSACGLRRIASARLSRDAGRARVRCVAVPGGAFGRDGRVLRRRPPRAPIGDRHDRRTGTRARHPVDRHHVRPSSSRGPDPGQRASPADHGRSEGGPDRGERARRAASCSSSPRRSRGSSAEDFVRDVLVGGVHARHAAMGTNFTFGFKAEGTVATLPSMGAPLRPDRGGRAPARARRTDGLVVVDPRRTRIGAI